jgi:hypothetical protein
MNSWFNYIGIFVKKDSSLPYNYNHLNYVNTEHDKVNAHKIHLEAIEKKEDVRLSIIDTKTSQLITYTGVIFSALSLFMVVLIRIMLLNIRVNQLKNLLLLKFKIFYTQLIKI